MRPRIGITMGDPAGIGPEIAAKAFGNGDWMTRCRAVVIGDASVLRQACRFAGVDLRVNAVDYAVRLACSPSGGGCMS